MKIRTLCSLLSALVLALTMTVSVAASGELLPGSEITENQEPLQGTDTSETPGFLFSSETPQIPETIMPPETIPTDAELQPRVDILAEEVINVAVPATGEVILNPYRLPVEMNGVETDGQVIHQAQSMINYSSFPVSVNVLATGSVWDARFVENPPVFNSGSKEIFLYAEFQSCPDGWLGFYQAAPNQLLITEYGTAGQNVLTLDAGGTGYFRLFGGMSTRVQPWWSSDNALRVTLAYSFERLPSERTDTVDVFDAMIGANGMAPVFPNAAPSAPEAIPFPSEYTSNAPVIMPIMPEVIPDPEVIEVAVETDPVDSEASPVVPGNNPGILDSIPDVSEAGSDTPEAVLDEFETRSETSEVALEDLEHGIVDGEFSPETPTGVILPD